MQFLLVRRRLRGVAIDQHQLRRIAPLNIDVHFETYHSDALGRSCIQAYAFNTTPGAEEIPRLLEARVTGMAQNGMNISGLEEVEGVLYAQSWWCRRQ